MIYDCTGLIDDWKIVHGQIAATSKIEARKKFRRQYKKPKFIKVYSNRLAD
jgi:hypothetical protein